MRLVIIGADAAGMSAASRIKRRCPEWQVRVFEKTEDVSYSACGMPYNIADPSRDIDDLVVRRAEVFRHKQGIDLRTGHEVLGIDRSARRVFGKTLSGQTFETTYDRLLLATGASPVVPDWPGSGLPGVMTLKSLGDGRRIKAFLKQHQVATAVIIGMGYIALEMCEALCALGIRVEMVKPRPVLLPWMPSEMATVVRGELETHGVGLHLGVEIRGIQARGGQLEVACADRRLVADLVLVAVGVRPNSDLAASAGLELGPAGAVAVDRTMRTSDPAIYAAGDCADAFHVVTGQKVWIPLALWANRGGWAAADHLAGAPVALQGVAGTAVFKVMRLQVARTGLDRAQAERAGFDPAEVVIRTRSRAHAHPGSRPIWVHMVADRASGRLLGTQLLGEEGAAHRVNAAAVALHQHMTLAAFSQCDLAYAPPFGPVWDPLLTAANQLLKQVSRSEELQPG